MPLSAAIITRNAAAQLERCLESVAFAEEVVVVDSGSTDGTLELAARRGARVIQKEWLGFGAQKQFAVEAASHDWVLCVDADERVSRELREQITGELKAPRGFVYAMPRRNRFLGRWLKHGEGYPDWSVRLFHRAHARWGGELRSEEHTSELQSLAYLVCRLLLEKKKKTNNASLNLLTRLTPSDSADPVVPVRRSSAPR